VSSNRDSLAAQQAAGLRQLADMIEQNPELAVSAAYLARLDVFHVIGADTLQAIIRAGLAVGATVDKQMFGNTFAATLRFGPVGVSVLGDRAVVCEKRVEAKVVVEEVPDPEAVAALPKVLQSRTEEVVSWECKPWMAEADAETVVAS
jgi:hypothetical protein